MSTFNFKDFNNIVVNLQDMIQHYPDKINDFFLIELIESINKEYGVTYSNKLIKNCKLDTLFGIQEETIH